MRGRQTQKNVIHRSDSMKCLTGLKWQVVERIKLRDYTTNTLSHVVSELVMRVGEWAGGALEPHRDTATYTCVSQPNREGPGVNSSTLFRSGVRGENDEF